MIGQTEQFEIVAELQAHSSSSKVISVVIAPDKSFIVTGANEKTLKIWDYHTFNLTTSKEYPVNVTHVNVHPTDKRIFVCLVDGTVSVLHGTSFV